MTSKTLFINLQKEDMKNRIWVLALGALLFLVLRVVGFMMMVERWLSQDYSLARNIILVYLEEEVMPGSESIFALVLLMAVLCGITGFSFLFSKRKVDFYHSLPVRRDTLFLAHYVNGIIIFVVLYFVSWLAVLFICGTNGLLTGRVMQIALAALGTDVLFYLLIYHVVILAVLLTGNLLISFCATGVFFFLAPWAETIIYGYQSSYFLTYFVNHYDWNSDQRYYNSIGMVLSRIFSYGHAKGSIAQYLSPVTAYMSANREFAKKMELSLLFVLQFLIVAAVVTVSFLVIRKINAIRPSEGAGKAVVFQKIKMPVKIAVMVVGSMTTGLFFAKTGVDIQGAWLWFGAILGILLFHCIMEICFEFDIQAVLFHKRQCLITALAVLSIVAVFRYDLFGYDTYLPKEDSIRTMSVDLQDVERDLNYYKIVEEEGEGSYLDKSYVLLDKNSMEEISKVYELAAACVSSYENRSRLKNTVEAVPLAAQPIVGEDTTAIPQEQRAEEEAYTNIVIKYNLKSGRQVYRSYSMPLGEVFDLMDAVYCQGEYKRGSYQLYNTKEHVQKGYIEDKWNTTILNDFSKEEMSTLIDIYLEELNGLSLKKMKSEYPAAFFNVEYKVPGDGKYYNVCRYKIYPSFVKTIAFLQERGVPAEVFKAEIDSSAVQAMTVTRYDQTDPITNEPLNNYATVTYGEWDTSDSAIRPIDSQEQDVDTEKGREEQEKINRICENIVATSLTDGNNILYNMDSGYEVTLKMEQSGVTVYGYCYFEKNKIPDFLIEDLNRQMVETQEY